MASPNRHSLGRDSVTERATLMVSPLLKRNREIAEVREQLLRADTEIDEAQARNHQLLEVHSELDSERTRQLQRAALSEQRLAEQFNATQQHEERLAAQEAKQQSETEEVRLALARLRAELMTVERAAKEEESRQNRLRDDLTRHRAEFDEQNQTLSELRQNQEQKRRTMIKKWQSEAADKAQASESKEQAASQRVQELKRSLQSVEAQVESETNKREELNQNLRRIMAQEADFEFDLKKLEQQVSDAGGDPREILARFRARERSTNRSASPVSPGRRRAEQGATLREELKNSEHQCGQLETKLTKLKTEDGSKISRLRASLDAARSELQTSLQEANREQQRETALLESQIEAEKRALHESTVEAAVVNDRIVRLRSALEVRSSELKAEADGQAEKHGQVTAHLRRLREAKHLVQDSLASCLDRRLEVETLRKKAMEEGSEDLARLRLRIRELWTLISKPLPKGYPMPEADEEQIPADPAEKGEQARFHDFVGQLMHIEELSGYSTSEVLSMLFKQQGLGIPGKRLPTEKLSPRHYYQQDHHDDEEGRPAADAPVEPPAPAATTRAAGLYPDGSPSLSNTMMPPMAPMINQGLDFTTSSRPHRASGRVGSEAAAATAAAVAAATATAAQRFQPLDPQSSFGRRFNFGAEWARRSSEVQAAVLEAHASGMLTSQFTGRSPANRFNLSRSNLFGGYQVQMQTSQVRVEELDDDDDPEIDPVNPFHLEPHPTEEQLSPSIRSHLAQLPSGVFGEGLTRSQQNAHSAAVLHANAKAALEIRRQQLELSGRSQGYAAPPPIGTAVAVNAGYSIPTSMGMGYQRVPARQ